MILGRQFRFAPGREGRRREEACVMYGFCSEGLRDLVRVRPNVDVGDEIQPVVSTFGGW